MKKYAILGVLLLSGACASTGSKPSAIKAPSEDAVQAIRDRASFDLACPKESIEVVVIEAGGMMRPWTFGATGCGKQASYLSRAGTIVKN